VRERREKEKAREKSIERVRGKEYRERERVQGDAVFESETRGWQTRESRYVDSTNVEV